METGDHYYDCLVSRLREENNLRAKAFNDLVGFLQGHFMSDNATKFAAWHAADRIGRNLDANIKASEDKWIEIQFKRQQADKHRR